MKKVYVKTRSAWRTWLARNHNRGANGIWLVFYRRGSPQPSLDYEEAVEEALCYGWIDSIIKKADGQKYLRKFTPRKANSEWSALNKRRVASLTREGRMTKHGLAKIEAAKRLGNWKTDPRPELSLNTPDDFQKALRQNSKAMAFFDRLAPSYRKQFLGWIEVAKRPETRERRIHESVTLLQAGRKLGPK